MRELEQRKFGPGAGGNRDGKLATQEAVIAEWIKNPFRSYKEIAAECGISDRTFWSYRQEPEFMNRVHEAMQKAFNALEVKAIGNLEKALDGADWQATKYVLDGLDYSGQQKISVESNNVNITIED